jgi:hypothetical protein
MTDEDPYGYIAVLEVEIERLRALLQEVLDDTPMYRIDDMTEDKIRAALDGQRPNPWFP